MKILFLDVDGVMNSERSIQHAHEMKSLGYIAKTARTSYFFGAVAIDALNGVIADTKAAIVISSTWRDTAVDPLKNQGVKATFLGSTPVIDKKTCRGDEILEWLRLYEANAGMLEDWGEITHVAIVDDSKDMGPLSPAFVHTEASVGLTEDKAFELCGILNGPPNWPALRPAAARQWKSKKLSPENAEKKLLAIVRDLLPEHAPLMQQLTLLSHVRDLIGEIKEGESES